MILGFAHITKNVPVELRPDAGIANPPEKWPYMAYEARRHRLTLHKDKFGLVEELVEYDTGTYDLPGRLDVGHGGVIVSARDRQLEAGFFRNGLGFQDMGSELGFVGHVHHWSVGIAIREDADVPTNPPLDIAGYAALAFYSSNVESDRDVALVAGGHSPLEPFTVKLDREMKIVMLRSPEGTIIELIQVVK